MRGAGRGSALALATFCGQVFGKIIGRPDELLVLYAPVD
jgi:hypothetical protein